MARVTCDAGSEHDSCDRCGKVLAHTPTPKRPPTGDTGAFLYAPYDELFPRDRYPNQRVRLCTPCWDEYGSTVLWRFVVGGKP